MSGDDFFLAAASFVFIAIGILLVVMAVGACGCIDSPTFRNDRNVRIGVAK